MPEIPLPKTRTGKIAAIVAAALLLLLVVSQLLLPGIGEGVIEDRLTENGGIADVSLSAKPAARLLWGSGDHLGIDATGLDLEVTTAEDDPQVFDNLDHFGDVDIVVRDSDVGPVRLDYFVISRSGDDPYSLKATGSTSPADLAEYAADDFDLPGGGILGDILSLTGIGGADVDIDLDMRIESNDGRVEVVDGGGEIGGIPTGPLAEFITSAVTVEI